MFSNNDIWKAEHYLHDLDYHHMNGSIGISKAGKRVDCCCLLSVMSLA